MLGSLKKTALLLVGYLVMSPSLALKCQIVSASAIQVEPMVEQDGLVQSSAKSTLGQTVQELDKAIMHVYHATDGAYW